MRPLHYMATRGLGQGRRQGRQERTGAEKVLAWVSAGVHARTLLCSQSSAAATTFTHTPLDPPAGSDDQDQPSSSPREGSQRCGRKAAAKTPFCCPPSFCLVSEALPPHTGAGTHGAATNTGRRGAEQGTHARARQPTQPTETTHNNRQPITHGRRNAPRGRGQDLTIHGTPE